MINTANLWRNPETLLIFALMTFSKTKSTRMNCSGAIGESMNDLG